MTFATRIVQWASPVLETEFIRKVRRNHGLEHATIHLLSRQRYTLSGRSDSSGFVLLGDVPAEKVEVAAREALRRMKRGESQLAIHPNCGTNLLTTSFLAALVAFLGFATVTPKRAAERFPLVMLGIVASILYGLPIGMWLQKHFTTSGAPGDLEVVTVTRRELRLPGRKPLLVLTRVTTVHG